MRDFKEVAKQIFFDTLNALDLKLLLNKNLKVEGERLYIRDHYLNLEDYKEILLVGFGKACVRIGAALEELLGERITRGLLVSDHPEEVKLKSDIIIAGHPLPDRQSLAAGKKTIELIEAAPADSLILFVITGGGSALVEQAISTEITLDDLREVNRLLIHSGATIREINIVRKHLSKIKGGRLGYLARDRSSVALFLSDVNPGDLRAIASNPLMPEDLGLEDFFLVLEKYRLEERLPLSILNLVRKREIPELPGSWDHGQKSIQLLLADNSDAINVAAEKARIAGLSVETDLRLNEGDYKEVSRKLIDELEEIKSRFPASPVCLISGGEVSCPVTGDGVGGRNQEFVLYTALELCRLNHLSTCVLSCGTDGIDGNSPAAGAVADARLIKQAQTGGVDPFDYLARNDSHSFFKLAGGLVETGPTGNNVRDLRILIAE